jgi:peptide/nickel transport system permease protein
VSESRSKRKIHGAAWCLAISHGSLLLAGFFAPYDEAAQNRTVPFTPPMKIRFVDTNGRFQWRPFVADDSSIHYLRFLVPGSRYLLFGLVPGHIHLFGVDGSTPVFLFGSDAYGRDQLSRMLYGGQISLSIGILSTALSLFVGLIAGLLAGYRGGWTDEIIMRMNELFLGLPWLYLLLALRAFMPLTFSPKAGFFALFAVIGILGWARPARLIRGVVLSLKERPYVLAARAFGARDSYIIVRHILPDVYSILLTQAALLAPQYILAEVTLSYLGLGIGEPAATLGTMLASFRELSVIASYWWMALPGLALLPIFYAYNILAQGLQELAASE